MTTEEYIASGILEMYASGGLPAHEQAEVAAMLQKHPELQAELNQIEKTLEAYAQLHATPAPAATKSKILASIANSVSNQAAYPTATATPNPEPKVIPITQEPVKTKPAESFNWLTAAAVILLLVSAGLNFYFNNNWKSTEGNLQLALNQQQEIAQNYRQARQDLIQTEMALHILENLDTRHVVMQGLAISPGSEAVIHWEPKSKTVLLNVKKLPAAPAGKQYQLWALKNGKPIDAGLFNPTDTLMGMQQMKTIEDAEAFAMTLEPAGGSQNPTMEEMYIMGKM